jgi:cell pole-organizing protein PopZ
MEEILASIRQIISEDGEPAPTGRVDAKAPVEAEPAAKVELAAVIPSAASPAEEAPARGELMKPQTSEVPSKAQPPAAPAAAAEAPRRPEYQAVPTRQAAPAPAPAPRTTWRPEERGLLSPDSDAAVSGAFSALAHTILAQNARTLEDLVVEMVRPMLRDWLDENLPPLVERLVQEEIQRVSRGRR